MNLRPLNRIEAAQEPIEKIAVLPFTSISIESGEEWFVDGMTDALIQTLTKEQAEAILSWIRCYCNCEYFPDQKDYCFISPGLKSLHGWGCKWLCSIIRHENFSMHNGIQWYKIGPFDGTVQYIDKQDIKDKLVEESKAKCLQLCPLFSLQKVFIYVNNLPDQIDPTNDENWEYEISPENKSKRIGVQPIETTVFDLLF